MKQEKYSLFKYSFSIAVFLTAISISTITFGGTKDSTLNANTIKSVVNGINSQNPGLAQSSIYLVGYHGFVWAVDPLINVLNDPQKTTYLRILAAYSLFMICDDRGMQAIRVASASDENYMLKGTCEFIYKDYMAKQAKMYTTNLRE